MCAIIKKNMFVFFTLKNSEGKYDGKESERKSG